MTSFDGTALDLTNPATRPWVDFVTVWGALVAAPGFVSRSGTGGRTVAVQVNASGQATVLLQADHAASFSEAEHVQVESALATRVTVGAQEMSVSEAILGGATPASSTCSRPSSAMTRAYTASGTNTTQRYLDTYYVQSPARVAPQLGFIPTNWTDYLVTVFAFVKPDGDPVSPDGAMASGSIQVTFRDWVRHWIVDDFFVDLSVLVRDYRGVLPGLIHTDLRVSVDGVMDEIERRVRGGGILGGQREFAAATDAVKTVRVQNAPAFFDDAMEAVSGGIAVQRAVSYGEAVTPRAGTSAQSARAVAGSTAKATGEAARVGSQLTNQFQSALGEATKNLRDQVKAEQQVFRADLLRDDGPIVSVQKEARDVRGALETVNRALVGKGRPAVCDRLRPPDRVTAMGMWETYLLPEEVSAKHAREVLDFLNQAPDAKTIAEAVEFPRELDVGLRVAQRILNSPRRAERLPHARRGLRRAVRRPRAFHRDRRLALRRAPAAHRRRHLACGAGRAASEHRHAALAAAGRRAGAALVGAGHDLARAERHAVRTRTGRGGPAARRSTGDVHDDMGRVECVERRADHHRQRRHGAHERCRPRGTAAGHTFPGAAQRRPAHRARTGGGTPAAGGGMADSSERRAERSRAAISGAGQR